MLATGNFNMKELGKERIESTHDYICLNLRIINAYKFMKSYLQLEDLLYESGLFERKRII
jgi:hypothetical protein